MFEVGDHSGQDQFTKLAVAGARPDKGPLSTLDSRDRVFGYPALPVEVDRRRTEDPKATADTARDARYRYATEV